MTELVLAIDIVDSLVLQVSILKKNADKKYHAQQTKNGLVGWLLFRKVKSAYYSSEISGNTVTSLVAKEWRKLPKSERLHWREIAELSDVCGNRWVNYV